MNFVFFCLFVCFVLLFNFPTDLCGDEFLEVEPDNDYVNVTSPFYPNQFSLTLDCSWKLMTSEPGSVVIVFQDLLTSSHHDELYIGGANATIRYDVDDQDESKRYLDSLDAMNILMFTGKEYPKSVVFHTNELSMGWDASIWSAGGRGFWIQVSWAVTNGIITSTCYTV